MSKNSNKYRVGVYLGKDLYTKLEQMAQEIGIPLSTTLKILLESGLAVEEAIEREYTNGK